MPEGKYIWKFFKFSWINEDTLKEIFNRDELLFHSIFIIYAPSEVGKDMYIYLFVENLSVFDLIEEYLAATEVSIEELFAVSNSESFNRLNIP